MSLPLRWTGGERVGAVEVGGSWTKSVEVVGEGRWDGEGGSLFPFPLSF